MSARDKYPRLFGVLMILWTLAALAHCAGAELPPRASLRYQRMLTAEARLQWGLGAPVPVMAAQINQESRWHERVCSAFACGLAQFTPSTAKWISGVYKKELAGANVFNPEWAIRALTRYDHFLYESVGRPEPDSECDQWAFTLSAYNGGLGWVERDRLVCRSIGRGLCDADAWFGNVADNPDPRRSAGAVRENRGYPRTILFSQQPYAAWGRTVACFLN